MFWRTATDEDVEGMSAFAIQLCRFMGWSCRGKKAGDVYDFTATEEDIASRFVYETHITSLNVVSIRTGDTYRRNMAICLDKDLHDEEKVSHAEAKATKFGLQVISGDHNRHMNMSLMEKFPNNKIWMKYIYMLFVNQDTEMARRFFRMAGNVENMKSSANRQINFGQKLYQMHTQAAAVAVRHGTTLMKLKPKYLKDLKDDWAYSLATKPNTITGMWSIAKCPPGVWTLLWRILNGRSDVKNFKKPSSHGPFTSWSGIPWDTIQEWLKSILAGEMECSNFKDTCLRYKAGLRAKAEVLSALEGFCLRDARENVFQDWDDVSSNLVLPTDFLASATQTFLHMKVSSNPDKKFFNIIQGMYERFHKDVQLTVCIYTVCFYLVDMFVFKYIFVHAF